jgi:hypothetical protein
LASTALNSVLNTARAYQSGPTDKFQHIQNEFQQLGTDLTAGNLTQAQADFVTLSQNFPGAQAPTATATTPSTSGTATAAGTAANASPLSRAFSALSQALGSGNLTAAQQDYATVQQDLQQQQSSGSGAVPHHHHHGGGGQQSNEISQALGSLNSALQSGNLSGAQSSFATLQNDLLQYTGYNSSGSSSSSSQPTGTNVSVTV